MFFSSIRTGWCRGVAAMPLLAAMSVAHAQDTPSRSERADPLDAQARVPVVPYQSPLAGYRRLGEDKAVPWKEANDTVTRIGGWRTYTREAQRPDAPASAPAHGGHRHPGGARR